MKPRTEPDTYKIKKIYLDMIEQTEKLKNP